VVRDSFSTVKEIVKKKYIYDINIYKSKSRKTSLWITTNLYFFKECGAPPCYIPLTNQSHGWGLRIIPWLREIETGTPLNLIVKTHGFLLRISQTKQSIEMGGQCYEEFPTHMTGEL
jgi:hypothetical protein